MHEGLAEDLLAVIKLLKRIAEALEEIADVVSDDT